MDARCSHSDSLTLARAGRMHAQLIEANLQKLLPLVLAHGYDPSEIQGVIHQSLADVS